MHPLRLEKNDHTFVGIERVAARRRDRRRSASADSVLREPKSGKTERLRPGEPIFNANATITFGSKDRENARRRIGQETA